MKKNRSLVLLLIALLLAVAVYFGFNKKPEEIIVEEPVIEEIVEPVVEEEIIEVDPLVELLSERWEKNKGINDEYVGEIHFESGIISLPFVYSGDNAKYLRRDWETMKHDEEGSIYMDEECNRDTQNIVLYGHYVYRSYEASGTHKFTPLELLKKQENYEDNKYIYLYLGDEYRKYEICAVFYCDLYKIDGYDYPNENLYYYLPEYDDEYFDVYKSYLTKRMFYETGVDFDNTDKFLTLQTCVENHNELREIVLSKEIERVKVEK